ncbi:MAG: hypothetical protein PVI54_11765 [Desulfobacteraceae bacterium]|jgi:hypothetical protein
MARADLILNLVKAGARGDKAQFKKTVEALAADERAKNHRILADRLIAQLQQDSNGQPKALAPPSTRSLSGPLVAEVTPKRRVEDLILRFEMHTKQSFSLPPQRLAQNLKGLSFAEIEAFGTDVMRRIALNQPDADAVKIVEKCLAQWKKRFRLKIPDLHRGDE